MISAFWAEAFAKAWPHLILISACLVALYGAIYGVAHD